MSPAGWRRRCWTWRRSSASPEADGATRVRHDLTQEELAQLVGASRETVNKALSEFAHRGWLRIDGRSVLLLTPDRLARRAR